MEINFMSNGRISKADTGLGIDRIIYAYDKVV
jgi:hypothetical protein